MDLEEFKKSITEMSIGEALDLIRSIRLERRMPKRSLVKKGRKKSRPSTSLSKDQAAQLLKILGGNKGLLMLGK